MANKIPTALVSDFDGTISDDDFFNYVSRRWLGEKALDPWREYTEGKKTHFEALREIFASLRVEQPAFDDFIREIKIDPGFFTVADYCRRRDIPVYVCSAAALFSCSCATAIARRSSAFACAMRLSASAWSI